ncbi:CBS domain-containing protein [Methylobacterium nodulans]|uniref:Putative signal transduction protein with CBS domains n=1 Tax=Methylobacterium nodulans (strain LMG 21967 / CNCM I-2342 / ORS 2060) TaxID=460265 RepID=B8IJV7_METNO|nr:CBS domain-containing protein [Methylobacterium nodulans]ACL59970.1 putative signal transduction protein with CBS domains [Methylobacterium nodulans ORS 2060]
MSVARILSQKGRTVVTVQPHRTLAEAAELLAERGIGALVVSDAGLTVLGIISERDMIRAIARGGSAVLEHPVSRYMTGRVITCTRSTAIEEVMELMTDGRFRHVPVVEEGHLVGLVSIGDVVKHRIASVEAEQQALREYIATA